MVDLDWLARSKSKAAMRVTKLIEALKTADLLSRTLQNHGASLPATSADAKKLLAILEALNQILSYHKGHRVLWVNHDYRLEEGFGFDHARFERDDTYYTETRITNYALELLRLGSIQRLRTCGECGKWYYGMTDHQTFCGPNCRQRHATRNSAFRERRREYMKKYRADEKQRHKRAERLARRTK